jgi:hypothetical protein
MAHARGLATILRQYDEGLCDSIFCMNKTIGARLRRGLWQSILCLTNKTFVPLAPAINTAQDGPCTRLGYNLALIVANSASAFISNEKAPLQRGFRYNFLILMFRYQTGSP